MNELHEGVVAILRRLLHKRRIGNKHTEESNVFRWIKNLSQKEQKKIRKDWDKCIKEMLVLRQKKTNQLHVSLNSRKLKEIYELIE